jgi:vitamin K-dependent gamma-carboxylase
MPTATAPAEPSVDTGGTEIARPSRAQRPVSAASTAVFRIAFGALVAVSMLRFVAKGWVGSLYLAPTNHLTYARFEWVRPLPPVAMHVLVLGLAAMGVGIAVGWRTRWCAAAFTIGFAYTELIEASLYLNHYWYVTLVGLLLTLLPTSAMWSVDAHRADRSTNTVMSAQTVPVLVVWALRAQIAVVYLFAGLAKVNTDWLLHAMPLRLWFADRTELPVIGPLVALPAAPAIASWFGLLFDLTIVGWLSWRRSRPFAYAAVVTFHLATAALFRIGMFPWVMVVATLVFFEPDWPVRLARRWRSAPTPTSIDASFAPVRPVCRATVGLLALLAVVQIALPLRHLAEPGDVRVTEEGYYLSWRVMLTEKSGLLDFVVTDPVTGDRWIASPSTVLTDWQAAQAAIRPDLLLAAAHLLDEHYRRERGHDVEVRADSWVSINGRPARRLIDPTIDLSAVARTTPLHQIVLDP